MSWQATEEHRRRKLPLFHLSDGTPVFYGDILWHPDRRRVGWYCTATFCSEDDETVTVRSPNGAVPTVNITDLRKTPPDIEFINCPTCGGTGKVGRTTEDAPLY